MVIEPIETFIHRTLSEFESSVAERLFEEAVGRLNQEIVMMRMLRDIPPQAERLDG